MSSATASMPKMKTPTDQQAGARGRRSGSAVLPLLLLAAGSSFPSRNARGGPGLSTAFGPPRPIMPQNHLSHARRTMARGEDRGAGDGRPGTTALFAWNKSGGRKVPQMPSLPRPTAVSSPPSRTEESEDTPPSADFYSASQQPATGPSTMVVMDVENVRGAASFRISHEALLSRIRLWREDRLSMASGGAGSAFLEPLLWISDHGVSPSVHHFGPLPPRNDDDGDGVRMPHNFGAVFAGPEGRTADDVIVDLVGLRCGLVRGSDDDDVADDPGSPDPNPSPNNITPSRNTTIVITADARLISRCQQARRTSSSLSDVIFVEPASLLQQLERYRTNSHEEERLFGEKTESASVGLTTSLKSGSLNTMMGKGKRNEDGKTNTMTSFKDSIIAMDQHAKFQARFQNNKKDSNNNEENKGEGPSSSDGVVDDDDDDDDDENNSNSAAALAAQLKTEQIRRQLLLSDAYYLARPSKNVRGRRAHTTSAAVHARYKNRNISKKQQKKLYQKRFGRKRKEDLVRAALTRKQLAARLQSNFERAGGSDNYEGAGADEDENGTTARSMHLLETLLAKFERDRSLTCGGAGGAPSAASSDRAATVLPGLATASGRVGSDDKWDPLGSTLSVPLSKGPQRVVSDRGEGLPPLRIVVISDTHGFEGGLARYADPSMEDPSSSSSFASFGDDESGNSPPEATHHFHADDFLLPRADLLLHCGDFAASGSRKTQRLAARRLDDFLARQTHIPEKVVVRGNHDPESPAKVLFPNSKALYVKESSTLAVNGVAFAIEPYSRRMAFRNMKRTPSSPSYAAAAALPECDVLVSHEPPKGVLDLTYHGFSAGSSHLRELVERAEVKPRLWLCGHIHESRGVVSQRFRRPLAIVGGGQNGDEEKSMGDASPATTMVINASNANSGRANRIVSGAVVVEVARRPPSTTSGANGSQTAEGTLRPRRVDYVDDFPDDSANGSSVDGLAGLGEDLELYVTRPGVRRRKGVPRSMRHQMKRVRSTLVASSKDE